ncbi:hypothetical protein LINGRAHAP2_LOCUS30579 [Linum grandiflorum]
MLGLPAIFICFFFFFLAGLFASNLIFQVFFPIFYSYWIHVCFLQLQDLTSPIPFLWQEDPALISKSRKLQSSLVDTKKFDYNLLPPGHSGDDSITLIPFQVLLFPTFILLYASFTG